MKTTDLIIIALKLLAVYLSITGLTNLPPALASAFAILSTDNTEAIFVVATSVHGLVYLIAGALLWGFSPKVARLIEGDIPQFEQEDNEFTVATVLTSGLIILGFFVLGDALPSLVRIGIAALQPSMDNNFPQVVANAAGARKSLIPWSDIVTMLVQLAFGIWLILGSRGIVAFLKKVRYAGR
ncbi:hypothetical protein GWN28_18280 [candidate division KSB1 bacterium]|nr:hypothetical protein [candidate division KSB1 bacterium]